MEITRRSFSYLLMLCTAAVSVGWTHGGGQVPGSIVIDDLANLVIDDLGNQVVVS